MDMNRKKRRIQEEMTPWLNSKNSNFLYFTPSFSCPFNKILEAYNISGTIPVAENEMTTACKYACSKKPLLCHKRQTLYR